MKTKKITYSLNYRKPKNSYLSSDELMVCIRFYYKCTKTNKAHVMIHFELHPHPHRERHSYLISMVVVCT